MWSAFVYDKVNIKIVKILINHGADYEVVDNRGIPMIEYGSLLKEHKEELDKFIEEVRCRNIKGAY